MKLVTKILGEGPDDFEKIVKSYTKYELKLHLLNHSADIADKNGFWGEFGVYSGKTLHSIAERYAPVYGFDSFKGLPEDWNEENPKGYFNIGGKPRFTPTDRMCIVDGWFEDSIPMLLKTTNIGTPKFIHFDADLYSSTKCIFDNFKPYFKDNCVMVFDEFFAYPEWQKHEYKALWEFLVEMENKINDIEVIGYSDQNNAYLPFAIKVLFK
jgi:hypothetical protein